MVIDLTVPVIRFQSTEDSVQATMALRDQQFEPRAESDTGISLTPLEDLDEALLVLQADGIACERADKPVTRLGSRKPKPIG